MTSPYLLRPRRTLEQAQFDRSILAGMREQQLRDTAIAQWQRDAAQQKGNDNA